jgi:hypothetical protein
MREINKKLSIINRVVIHPKYRTIGLGTRIIRETLELAGTECVEMVAVIAKYNPFAEKAGLQKITEQNPLKSIMTIAALLSDFGFNLQLLSSPRYVSKKLDSLSSEKRENLKELFIKNKHPRFEKEFAISRHQPFGKTSDYVESINNANPEKITKLVKLVGMLLQAKVYLFWKHNTSRHVESEGSYNKNQMENPLSVALRFFLCEGSPTGHKFFLIFLQSSSLFFRCFHELIKDFFKRYGKILS